MDDEKDDKQLLPATYEDDPGGDGFDQPDEQSGVIVGPLEKFVDGDWTTGGLPIDQKRCLVAVATDVILQRWHDGRVIAVETVKPLPDLNLLNEAIPKSEWEIDPNNKPRPPWQRAHIIYFLDINTAERSTFISATIGGSIGAARLKDKVRWMRRMRGANVVPQVELSWAPFPTQFGMRKRPHFNVVGWFDLSAGGGTPLPATDLKQLPPMQPKQVKEPSTQEDLNDIIPFS